MERVRIVSLKGLSRRQEAIVREGQMEAARVWSECRDMHLKARQEHTPWPGRNEYHKATRGGRFALHSQSVQQVFRAFDAAVESARENRRAGHKEIRYPYKDKRFFALMWPAQAMALEEKRIVLPMGRGRPSLVFPRPEWLTKKAACKVVWNGVHNELHISLEEAGAEPAGIGATEKRATADLGQIHQAAVVTNEGEALVVSGRGIRSLKRLHSKQLGEIQKKRSRCTRGSRRWRKLGKTRAKLTLRHERRVRDLRQKGTRQVVDFCKERGVEALFVGDPDGVRRKNRGRHHNQRMSQWEYGKDISYLEQKSEKDRIVCFTGDERGTSSRCPVCGHRHKPKGRNWRCKACGFVGHRDIVGAVNMHPIAYGQVVPFPNGITYLRPGSLRRSSSPGTGLPQVNGGSCLAESRNQAPQRAIPLRVPSGNRPQTENIS
ncbi:MAG: transposase [Acidithiobacillus caldus]|uniref:RNA-guided endonuclease InsQ/TnpB family protein n=1 Tax=Acidithiobacillus caldus TaxID=33059 RepID=UPI00281578C9|nr:transposase [Acidithiobacillus caldus]WMT47884.1 MAG: transposase [Acidithiobacillus caldus]